MTENADDPNAIARLPLKIVCVCIRLVENCNCGIFLVKLFFFNFEAN